MNEDFGVIEDGFGGSWARCCEDCELEVVRPGKTQCGLCDSKCLTCGNEIQYFTFDDCPFEGCAGSICVHCFDEWGHLRKPNFPVLT